MISICALLRAHFLRRALIAIRKSLHIRPVTERLFQNIELILSRRLQ